MSNKQVQLRELILSLTTAERRYFKKFVAGKEEDTSALKLFDTYLKYPGEDEAFIKTRTAKLFKEKTFAVVKQKLFHSICDVMCYYHRDTQQYFSPYHELQKINFLIIKDIKSDAARYARELRQDLYNSPVQVIIPTLYGIESFVHLEQKNLAAYFELLKEQEKVTTLSKGLTELHDTRTFLWALSIAREQKLSNEQEKTIGSLEEKFRNTYNRDKHFASPAAKLNYLTALLFNKENTAAESFKISQEIFQLVSGNAAIFSTDAHLYAYDNLIHYAILNQSYSAAQKSLDELESFAVLTRAQEKIKAESSIQQSLLLLTIREDFKRVRIETDRLKSDPAITRLKLSTLFKAQVYAYRIFANLFTGDAAENKKIILHYAAPKLKKLHPELLEVYRMLEIMTLVTLKDFDLVTYQLRNAKLAFGNNKELKEFLNIVEAVKNNLENGNKPDSSLLNKADQLNKLHLHNSNAHLFFRSFNGYSWVNRLSV